MWGSVGRGSEVVHWKLPSAHEWQIKELVGRVEGEAFSQCPLGQKQDQGYDDGWHATGVLRKASKGHIKEMAKSWAEDERRTSSQTHHENNYS